jgi:hypothetical protein
MEAGHEREGGLGKAANELGPDGDDLAKPGTGRKALVAFAGHFTAVTTDAVPGILKDVILAHFYCLPVHQYENIPRLST